MLLQVSYSMEILQIQPNRDDDGRERRHTGAGAAVFAVPGVASGTMGTKLIQQQPASAGIGERAAPDVMGNRVQQPKAGAAGGSKKIMSTTNPELADGAIAAVQG